MLRCCRSVGEQGSRFARKDLKRFQNAELNVARARDTEVVGKRKDRRSTARLEEMIGSRHEEGSNGRPFAS